MSTWTYQTLSLFVHTCAYYIARCICWWCKDLFRGDKVQKNLLTVKVWVGLSDSFTDWELVLVVQNSDQAWPRCPSQSRELYRIEKLLAIGYSQWNHDCFSTFAINFQHVQMCSALFDADLPSARPCGKNKRWKWCVRGFLKMKLQQMTDDLKVCFDVFQENIVCGEKLDSWVPLQLLLGFHGCKTGGPGVPYVWKIVMGEVY